MLSIAFVVGAYYHLQIYAIRFQLCTEQKSAATVRSSSRGRRIGKAVLAASATAGGGDVVAPAPVDQEVANERFIIYCGV